LGLPLSSCHAIRPEEAFRARSYNLARQVLGLVDHLFVRYPVPGFLYRSILSPAGMDLVFDVKTRSNPECEYRDWFLTVAQGGSFAKLVKATLTKKEAHLFLQAPNGNSIMENLFWARAAATGLPRAGCDYLLSRLDAGVRLELGDRTPDLLRFYAEAWGAMRGLDRDEITDFVRAMARDANFTFKGRTLDSMRKHCAEWHRTSFLRGVREFRNWGACLPVWSSRKGAVLVRAEELTNNRLLAEEGAVQRHCVYSYAGMCASGRSAIVSLRWYAVVGDLPAVHDFCRLTLEVNPAHREVVQIRGKMNRRATTDEMKIVRLWAGEHGLTISSWA
jgi:hypothetical protein